MPIYVYEHRLKTQDQPCEYAYEFEYSHSIHDNALKHCPHCGMPVKRLIAGGVTVNWKGQGPPTPNYHG